ncbi:AAA family ATPase [Rhodoflexus sp.]
MRPHFLEIQAFGPYIERQRIDFSKFSGGNLFLLHGPTGAGKTTIFDAMSCALFGSSTGDRNHKNMRSDFAPPQIHTLINFAFAYRGRYFLASYKFKQRDSDPEHILFSIDANVQKLEKIATGTRKVQSVIKDLLQISKDQFLQVVVLPQGEFQKFLRANGATKEAILGTIFRTKRFDKLQESLKNQVKLLHISLENLQSNFHAILSSIKLPQGATIASYFDELKQKKEALEQRLDGLQKENDAAQAALQQAKNLAADFEEFRKRQEEYNRHESTEDDYKQQKAARAKAEKVRSLAPKFKILTDLKTSLKKAEAAKNTTETALASVQEKLNKLTAAKQAHESLKSQAEKARNEVQRLTEKLPDFENLTKLIKQAEDLRKKLAREQDQERQTKEQLTQVLQRQNALQAAIKAYQSLAADIPLLERQLTDLKKQADDWAHLQKEKDLLSQLERQASADFIAYEAKRKDALIARQKYDEAEQVWRSSQAALLAQTLTDGAPCPVCGSLEHPAPAPLTDKIISYEQLKKLAQQKEQAEKQADNFREKYNAAQIACEKQKGICQTLEQNLKSDAWDETQLREQIQLTEKQLQQAQNAQDLLEKAQQTLQDLAKQDKQLQETAQKTAGNLLDLQTELSGKESRKNLLISQLPAEIPDAAAARKQITALQKEYAAWEQEQNRIQNEWETLHAEKSRCEGELKQLQAQIAEMTERRRQMLAEVEQESVAKGFTDAKDAHEKVQQFSETRFEALQKAIEQWEEKANQLKGAFEQAQQKIAGQQAPDLTALTQKAQTAAESLSKAQKESGTIAEQISQLEKVMRQLTELGQKISEHEEKLRPLQKLSELAEGKNSDKMKLHQFVLQFYFEQVLQAANLRLNQLSNGRYELHNDITAQKRAEIDGLKMVIYDHHTGTTRPVENLSGGETFFTSLALALGLTDVITSQSGGIGLESMFIDEGFGTLDSETLDLAIRTLSELEGSQRLVGIISHVSELKERIPAKIEVKKERKGSKIVQT